MLRLFRKERQAQPKAEEASSPSTRESPPSILTRIGSAAADLTRGTRSSQSPRKTPPAHATSSSFSQHAKESSTSMLSKSVMSRPSIVNASPWPTQGALRVLRSDAAAPLGMRGLCFASATHSIEGERHGMEDYNVSADMGNGVALFAVIDGHGGRECAAFLAEKLASAVRAQFQQRPGGKSQWPMVLSESFVALAQTWDRSPDSPPLCGAVMTAMLVSGLDFTVAHVGDCGVAASAPSLGPGEATVMVTTPHHVTREDEAERIVRAGGAIEGGRLLGVLKPSRAFGNLAVRASRGGDSLISECDTHECTLRLDVVSGDGFLLMCSDGIWDCLTVHEAGAIARAELHQSHSPALAAKAVAAAAMRQTKDDITVTVVYYRTASLPIVEGSSSSEEEKAE